MNRLAVKAMEEAGVDISRQHSKHVEALAQVTMDFVVTVCDSAHQACPHFPGRVKILHAGFDDPPKLARDAATDADAMPHYRRVRDEIRHFIERLPQHLSGEST